MKISVNDVELFSLNDIQKQILAYEIPNEILEDDLKRRLNWILSHKIDEVYKSLRSQWEPKLIAEGAKSLPTDKEEFASLVFAHPDYKDRSARELEAQKESK